ncbi:metallophosphoesterase [Lacrimispora sp. 210928-DFI.3.58]|uniref:metallophosphoesterase n=1 Tax=Lacrimispora sp. 210928-DFI.3.58 TaxID=2883214 RepID=UPI0015B755EA|nr:metallophosphoesterase [Lacrimispora sp. 210928-DFI.3.58]MCB7319429.1 metallophosphoesterase [Lacrimispora sp. 210928-DFI.3.58]
MGTEKNKKVSGSSTHLVWEVARRRWSKTLPDNAAEEWLEQFELTGMTEEKAVVVYRGSKDPEEFLSKYSDGLRECLSWAAGRKLELQVERTPERKTPEIRVRKKKKEIRKEKRKGSSGRGQRWLRQLLFVLLPCFVAVVVFIGINVLKNRSFKETFYQVGNGKVDGNLRVIHISDLHNTVFGKDNQELIRRIGRLSPDILILSGDIIDENDASMSVTLDLCRQLVDIAPVYYIYGNNEATKIYGIELRLDLIDEYLGCTEENRDFSGFLEKEDELKTMLEAMGVHVLLNSYDTLEVNGLPVDVYGVLTSNPYAFWPYAGDSYREFIDENTDHLKLMVSHEPYIYETYGEGHWGDLVLCGHTHGGLVRLPYLGAVYERKNGWFPERKRGEYYVSGKYDVGGYPLIVNNGLSNRGAVRINNQPELVIIDMNRY